MNTVTFYAAGEPKGQPRPRAFARKMGNKFVARVFDAGTAEGWKGRIALAAHPYTPASAFAGPVAVSLTFYFARPKNQFRTGKNAHLLRDGAPTFHTAKPDADNLAKAVLDCMTQLGRWWADDSQVSHLLVEKRWAPMHKDAGVLITVSSLL